MLNASTINLLDQVAKILRKSEEPFGGIRLLVCGDFLSNSPFPWKQQCRTDVRGVSREIQDYECGSINICCQSKAWDDAGLNNKIDLLSSEFVQDPECRYLSGTIILKSEDDEIARECDNLIGPKYDPQYKNILDAIREGKITESMLHLLNTCAVAFKPRPSSRSYDMIDEFSVVEWA